MAKRQNRMFLSYSGEEDFEANLLKFALEVLMKNVRLKVWTYRKDQNRDERDVAGSLKKRIRESIATLFLVSPSTINDGATQWMELAYSDAFAVPTFVLLHHLTYEELKAKERSVPPLLLAGQCTEAVNWKSIESRVRRIIRGARNG